jgi:hypothetical protein
MLTPKRKHDTNGAGEAAMTRTLEDVERAIERAGFRLENNLAHPMLGPTSADELTLWCKECGRDSGFHYGTCSKARQGDV